MNQRSFYCRLRSFLSNFFLILSCLVIFQCSKSSNDLDGKLEFYNSGVKKSFSFSVSDEFVKKSKSSGQYSSFYKISKSEMILLKRLLRDSSYCFNDEGDLSFILNSRQEKVYDVTFSSLVVKNYNARPVSPVIYFGECV